MKEEELVDLKYRQLQKLAKEHGIAANLKKAAIIAALIQKGEIADDDSLEPKLQPVLPDEEKTEPSNPNVGTSSRRGSRKRSKNDSLDDQSTLRGSSSSLKTDDLSFKTKSFDKEAFDAEAAKVEEMTIVNECVFGQKQRVKIKF